MKGIAKGLLLLSVTLCAVYANSIGKQSNLPSSVDCTNSLHCPPGYCCTIGHERYSYPQCQKLNGEGDVCRPNGPMITSGSRYYPDGLEIVIENVHIMFCPCADGLGCDRKAGGVCRNSSQIHDLNQVDHGSDSRND